MCQQKLPVMERLPDGSDPILRPGNNPKSIIKTTLSRGRPGASKLRGASKLLLDCTTADNDSGKCRCLAHLRVTRSNPAQRHFHGRRHPVHPQSFHSTGGGSAGRFACGFSWQWVGIVNHLCFVSAAQAHFRRQESGVSPFARNVRRLKASWRLASRSPDSSQSRGQ